MRRRTERRGFTLLELLIVLSLLGLLSALVAPRMLAWIDAAQRRNRLQALQQEVQALPERAFLSGTSLHWMGGTDDAPKLPALNASPRWQLRARPGLHIDANGMTEAAELDVLDDSGRVLVRWDWEAPTGRLKPRPISDSHERQYPEPSSPAE